MANKRPRGYSNSTLDQLWSKKVKQNVSYMCEICLNLATEAHHIQPKKLYNTRWDTENGVALCSECHKEAHKNPLWFYNWIISKRGYNWMERLIKNSKEMNWRERLVDIKEKLL